MTVDPNNPVPIFEQIVAGLCAAVAAGVHRPGELVPSVRQQAIALRVNPNTVQRAYEQLERDGLLALRRGTGMEVTADAPALAAAQTAAVVRQTFARGIDAGRAAKLTRNDIDALYDRAWKRS
jgi:GntR family transcriptional regulator